MRMKWSFPILKVWGIPIKLHASIVLIIPVLLLDFEWAQALVYGVGMFVSITLHELGHCFVAMRKGCRVTEILLLPIGGVARMERIPTRPRDEALMAIAGPAVSLFLFAVLCFGGGLVPASPAGIGGGQVGLTVFDKHFALAVLGRLFYLNIFQVLGLTNLVLLLFNLIPAFPMDGGRILRAWLTSRLGLLRATFVAALMGKAGAVILVLVGYYQQVWTMVAVAVFVYIAAGQEYRAVERKEGLKAFGFDPLGDSDRNEWQDKAVIGPPPYGNSDKPTTAAPVVREHRNSPFHRF